MKFLKGLMKDSYYTKTSEKKSMKEIKCPVCGKDLKVENVINYDDYVIVAEEGRVFQYECDECVAFIQVFVND